MYKLKIADLIIEVKDTDNRYLPYFIDYKINTQNKADINIDISNSNDGYLDAHEQLSKQIVKYNGLLIHGAAISYKDNAYLFIAPSGTGKTTHIELWKKHLNDLVIINGDKPIIRIKDNKTIIYGSPWSGKEHYNNNISKELKSVVILHRGNIDKIEKVDKKDYFLEIMKQICIPDDKSQLLNTMELINKVFDNVNVYVMDCTMNDSAFKTCFKTLTGEEYEN